MAAPVQKHNVLCLLFWPVRANLAEFETVIQGPACPNGNSTIRLSYASIVSIAGVPFPAVNWTRLEVEFSQPFQGSDAALLEWARTTNGRARLMDEALRLQNFIIDHVKASAPYNANTRNLRHFGPAEWPYVSFKVGDQVAFERANASLRAGVSFQPLAFSGNAAQSGVELAVTVRGLLRACDLADCGYPTEALLLCAGLLDATVQKTLTFTMKAVGLSNDAAEALLRNTTQRRLSTYLDPVLKLVCGHSLKDDNGRLFEQVAWMNAARNDAIHNGKEVRRSEAREACLVTFDTLDYLRVVSDSNILLPDRPSFGAD